MEVETEQVEIFTKKNLVLPVSRIDRSLRKQFCGKRVSAGSAIYATSALQNIFTKIIKEAEETRQNSKKRAKRIDRVMLIKTIRNSPELARLFRSYAFAPEGTIKMKNVDFLTKLDKEVVIKKREAKKLEEAVAVAETVPNVDE